MKNDPLNQANDPYLYASMLDSFMTDRNPFQAIAGDLGRMVKVMINIGKNRQYAQEHIEHLQSKVERVEAYMATVNPQTSGTRINHLR